MSIVPSQGSGQSSARKVAQFVDLIRSFPSQARLALGVRGVALATVAGIVGLLSCAIAFADIALSLHQSDVDPKRRRASEILALDSTNRLLMRSILDASSGRGAVPDQPTTRAAWADFQKSLTAICRIMDADIERLQRVCEGREALFIRLTPEIETFEPPTRLLERSTVAELLAIRDDINLLSEHAARDADAMVGTLIDEYEQALLVLTLSTIGFVGAGLVLILLVGRASVDHHRQWRSAQEARDLLQETLEALPAGVVVYDRDERLVLFNSVAASVTPSLQRPEAVGRPYEEMVRETARLMEEAGAGRQPWETWLAYFRGKNVRRLRQTLDGRWFEWSEKLTPSGRTVGLRVDATENRRRELELERERTRYRLLVDSLSDTVYMVDKYGVVTYASAAAHELLGVPVEQFVGRRLREFVVAEDVERALAEARAHYQSKDGGVRQVHLRMKRANGAVRHVEVRSRKPAGDEGADAALIGIIHDVTDRVDLAERLQRQMAEVELARADYQSLVDSLSDAVFKADAKSAIITFASAATDDVMGVPAAEIVGMSTFDHIHADDIDYVKAASRSGLQGRDTGVVQLQYRVETPAGAVKHVETRFRKTPGPDGRSHVVGVVRDVEERVRLSKRLDAEMARLRSIVESSGALIAMTDRDLDIVMVNSGFTTATGIPAEDAIGKPLRQVVDLPLDEAVLEGWRRAPQRPEAAEPVRFVNRLRDAQGRTRVISITATPALDAGGRFNAVVFLGVDDTERSEAEQALFAVERLSTVGEMAATMAHEISQPLQVINLACETARDEIDDAADRGAPPDSVFLRSKLDRVVQQVERASRIVGELRAFVRGTGADEPERSFDVVDAVRASIELMTVPLRRQGATIVLDKAEKVGAVKGHIAKLEQVLVNLINNARDAGAHTIALSVEALDDGPHPMVSIAVEDDGPGIAPDVLPRLFVAFFTTKERGKGTGFGLRICRRIVEEMGGSISARNRREGGARFEVVLPTTGEDPFWNR